MKRKMRSRRRRRQYETDESGLDLTPLLDVVFIMLIFFIVTATFTKNSGIDIRRPESQSSKQLNGEFFIISIDKTNQIWLENKLIDRDAVENHIQTIRTSRPEIALVIEADGDSITDYVVAVMDAARKAGITKISLAADTK